MIEQKRAHAGQIRLGRVITGVAAALLCTMAMAANQSDWWIDIVNDRVDDVKAMLAQGANPNELSPKGQPAIMLAIRDNAWHVYDFLARNPKTDVNAINIHRETPLMYLAIVGQVERAQALINRGAQVNRLGWTPLQYAASKGQVNMVKLLIANKAIINAPAPDGTTALMMAAYAGNEAIVRLLLTAGADVTTQNLKKQDAADWARMKDHNALARKIDTLIARTLARRAAARTEDRGNGAASASGQDIKPLDLDQPVPVKQAPPKTEPDNSTSRYFDLQRFDQDDASLHN